MCQLLDLRVLGGDSVNICLLFLIELVCLCPQIGVLGLKLLDS